MMWAGAREDTMLYKTLLERQPLFHIIIVAVVAGAVVVSTLLFSA